MLRKIFRNVKTEYDQFGATKTSDLKKLNLCSGNNTLKGYVNTDMFKGPGIDKVFDIRKPPFPFKENEFDEIYCRHILNHISEDHRMEVFDELYRIGKPGCVIKILVPFAWSNGSFGHIQHQSFFVKGSFNYYKTSKFFDIKETKAEFKLLKEELITYGGFRRFLPLKDFLSKFLINIYDDIYYELRIVKN
ncbi:hypothetical protein CL617_03490 [archaeon]|nr:hypothetical protein [archaeon]|tara:strand:+ start:4290 stop:4862 length:573 start_codon:yes stop_codon:yes gene_type:complete